MSAITHFKKICICDSTLICIFMCENISVVCILCTMINHIVEHREMSLSFFLTNLLGMGNNID